MHGKNVRLTLNMICFFFRGSSTQLACSYSVAHSPIPDVPEESSHFALGSSCSKMLLFEFKISGVSYSFFSVLSLNRYISPS